MNIKELLAHEPMAALKVIEAILEDVGDEYQYDSDGRLWAKVWSVESGCHEVVMRWDPVKKEWFEESWDASPFKDD